MNNNKVAVLSDALFAIANVATVYGTNSKDTILKNEIHKAIKKAIEIIDNGSTSFVSDEFLMKSNREWLKKFDQDFEIDTMKEQGDLFYPQGTDKLPDNVNFWESLYEKKSCNTSGDKETPRLETVGVPLIITKRNGAITIRSR
jgi:hypothetical protein